MHRLWWTLTPHLNQMQTLRQAPEVGTPVSLFRGGGAEGRTRLRCTCPGIMTLETSPGLCLCQFNGPQPPASPSFQGSP